MPEDPSFVSGMEGHELLARIAARPRPTGGEAVHAARVLCMQHLRSLGFDVREVPFEFSGFPGRFGTPLVGALGMGLVAVAGHLGARGARVLPLLALFWGGLALLVLGRWLARRGVLHAPLMRENGVNVEATRPGQQPRVWLCAHLDSKSQPIPTLVRAAGVGLQSIGTAATLMLALGAALGMHAAFTAWVAAVLVTLVGSIPVVLSVVGARSRGALDNASGVVTVLTAARQLKDFGGGGVGVLLTDAEELGLAGAQAWASRRAPAIVLNCDGVDDTGTLTIMQPRGQGSMVVQALWTASQQEGIPARVRGTPLGLLTDSIAFAQHGFQSVTFSRGTWASLARVHSARDDLSLVRGRGIPEVANVMAATARLLASRATNT